MVGREIRSRYRTSALDVFWALLNPVVTMGVYGFVLTQGFEVESRCGPYLVSAWSGLVLWVFFASSLTASVTSIVSASPLVTKVYFPREVLPLAATGSAIVELLLGLLTVLILLVIGGIEVSASAALAVLPVFMLVLWAAALGVFLAAFAAFARDIVHAVFLLTRVGIFAVPVFYEERILPPVLNGAAGANPVAVAIESFREAALCGRPPALMPLAIHTVIAACLLFLSSLYMRRVEARITDLL